MLIDVSDISTIPEEVEQKILERLNSLSSSITSKIKVHKIRYNKDVDCAIENYIGLEVAYSFYQELIPVFNQYKIVCYHFTKILDKNVIFSEGLRTNEWDVYSKNITHTLQILKVPEKILIKCVKLSNRDMRGNILSMGGNRNYVFIYPQIH